MSAERVISRIVIERFLTDDGADLVRVDSGEPRMTVVEALGLLQLAIYDVCNAPGDEEDE